MEFLRVTMSLWTFPMSDYPRLSATNISNKSRNYPIIIKKILDLKFLSPSIVSTNIIGKLKLSELNRGYVLSAATHTHVPTGGEHGHVCVWIHRLLVRPILTYGICNWSDMTVNHQSVTFAQLRKNGYKIKQTKHGQVWKTARMQVQFG